MTWCFGVLDSDVLEIPLEIEIPNMGSAGGAVIPVVSMHGGQSGAGFLMI